MRHCEHTLVPANKPKLTHATEFQEDAIRGVKFGKVPGLNGIYYRAFKHLPLSVVSLLVAL
jgi:hypothetical protein